MKTVFKVAVANLTDEQTKTLAQALIDYQDEDDAAIPGFETVVTEGKDILDNRGDGTYLGYDRDGDLIAMHDSNPFWDEGVAIVSFDEAMEIIKASV